MGWEVAWIRYPHDRDDGAMLIEVYAGRSEPRPYKCGSVAGLELAHWRAAWRSEKARIWMGVTSRKR